MSERTANGTSFDASGPPEGSPLVLIHGLGLTRHVFDGLMPALSRRRVVRYDLYGHGTSAPAPAEMTLQLLATQVTELLDHLGIAQAHLVGFSIGGMINRRVALDAPDRVASLVILNSPHDRGPEAQRQVEERALTVRQGGAAATLEAALDRWFTPAYRTKGAGVSQVRDWRAQVDPESYAGAAWVLANGVRELIAPDPPIPAPTLVMTCARDSGSTPAMAQAIAAEIAGAECRIVPASQHLGLMEQPQLFADPITRFLEGLQA